MAKPAIDLVSEYAVFASYIQDLVKISDKYNQAKVYSGIPIMFADKNTGQTEHNRHYEITIFVYKR